MKVITGLAKGRPLQTPEGLSTRPTVSRVKEGIFSSVFYEIEGRRVLDLFAGSGQMGIEALSRGAVSCVFVDASREAAAVIRTNLQTTGLAAAATVLCRDSLSFLQTTRERFDLVFLDPPYEAGLYEECLRGLSDRVAAGGIVLCESDDSLDLPDCVGRLQLERRYRYGRVAVRRYRAESQGETR